LGRQFAKMFPDPNYKYIAPWDGFNNFSFGLVKIIYVILFLFFFAISLGLWGSAQDRQDFVTSLTVASARKAQIMNIGLAQALRERQMFPDAAFRTSNAILRVDKMRAAGTVDHQKTKRHFKFSVSKAQNNKRTHYVHALKLTHNLFSIYFKWSTEITRAKRVIIYTLRWFGLIFVDTLFLKAMGAKNYAGGHVVLVTIFSFPFAIPIPILLEWLLKSKSQFPVSKTNATPYKVILGYLACVCYAVLTIILTLFICSNSSRSLNNALLITFFIQFILDIFVNQPVKTLVCYELMIALTKHSFGTWRGFIMKILEDNMLAIFK